jgi:hypothetical protein
MISKLKLSSGGFMKTSVKLVSCLLFFTLLMTISCSSPQTTETKSVAPENELVGVWKVAEVTFTGPEAKTITAQPGYLNFTKKHVSSVGILGEEPRTALPKNPTDAQKAADYNRLVADVSTYEVKGNTVTQHFLVNADSNIKPSDSFGFEYRIEGNNLLITAKADQNGPIEYPYTLKLVRVE